MTEIIVFRDPSAHARGAATLVIAEAARAIEARGRFTLALAGGSTPEPTYRLLAGEASEGRIDWARVDVFWGDERCVPPDDWKSNYRLAREALLDHVAIPAANVHRMRGEEGPSAGAETYTEELTDFFRERWPTFDLVLLGMGADGHTASLFPGSRALAETDRPAAAVPGEEAGGEVDRISLTAPAINRARHVAFLVTGGEKAGTLQDVLEGPGDRYPAQRIEPRSGRLTWLLDRQAAEQLEGTRWRWGQ